MTLIRQRWFVSSFNSRQKIRAGRRRQWIHFVRIRSLQRNERKCCIKHTYWISNTKCATVPASKKDESSTHRLLNFTYSIHVKKIELRFSSWISFHLQTPMPLSCLMTLARFPTADWKWKKRLDPSRGKMKRILRRRKKNVEKEEKIVRPSIYFHLDF